MDFRVEIDFSPKANDLLNRLIETFGSVNKTVVQTESEKITGEIVSSEESEQKSEAVKEATDARALRQAIKDLSIDIARSGKSAEIKVLTSEYGVEKQSDLPDEVLEEYMSKLKEM